MPMIKKFLIMLIIFSWTAPGFAQDAHSYTLEDLHKVELRLPTGETTSLGKISILNKGEPAPYAGYLLDVEAMANNISKYNALLLASENALLYQRQYDLELLSLETKKLLADIELQKDKSDILLVGKDKEIKRLQKLNQEIIDEKTSFWDDFFLATGSAATGILVGIITGLVISNQ